jgi:sulfofructosephosphate aldolase
MVLSSGDHVCKAGGMTVAESGVAGLAGSDGVCAMLALDHRGSLRAEMLHADDRHVDGDTLRAFKRIAIDELAPDATAMLLDLDYGMDAVARSPLPAGTALILAAQQPDTIDGNTIRSTTFDARISPEHVARSGAAALKLLVNWTPDGDRSPLLDFTARFVELSRACGVSSLVEGITWPSTWTSEDERDDAILDCAIALCATGCDVYKGEVAGFRGGDVDGVHERARAMTAAIDCPWVVLSHGVDGSRFAEVTRASCAGGASGFLAGQALWSAIARGPLDEESLRDGFRGLGRRRLAEVTRAAREGVEAFRAA